MCNFFAVFYAFVVVIYVTKLLNFIIKKSLIKKCMYVCMYVFCCKNWFHRLFFFTRIQTFFFFFDHFTTVLSYFLPAHALPEGEGGRREVIKVYNFLWLLFFVCDYNIEEREKNTRKLQLQSFQRLFEVFTFFVCCCSECALGAPGGFFMVAHFGALSSEPKFTFLAFPNWFPQFPCTTSHMSTPFAPTAPHPA